jgi:hypothetical protein
LLAIAFSWAISGSLQADDADSPSTSPSGPAGDVSSTAEKDSATYSRSFADREHTLTLTQANDQPEHLLAKDRTGKVIFDGPVATEEQLAKVPAALVPKLKRLQQRLTLGREAKSDAAPAKSASNEKPQATVKSPAAYRQLLEKKEYKDNPNILNFIAWTMVDPELPFENPDLDVALAAALRANEVAEGKRSDILDTVARVYFTRGDVAKAIEFQTMSVEKAAESEKENLKKTLSQYLAKQKEKKSTH